MDEILKEYQKCGTEKRLSMVSDWAQRRERQGIPLLIFALGDPEWRVRKAASAALLQFERDLELIECLVEELKNEENAGARNAAVEVLIGLGSFSVYPLMSIFRDVDSDIKKFIIDILGDINDRRANTFLIKALDDENENVCLAAIEALGKMRIIQSVPNLIHLLNNSSPLITFTVVRSLEMIGDSRALDPLISMMNKKGLERVILETLGSFGDLRALNPILSALHVGGKSIKNCAIRSLLSLSSKIPKHQEVSIAARLREIYSQNLGGHLIEVLGGSDAKVKSGAIKIFGWVSDINAVKELVPFLEGELKDEVIETFILMGREAVEVLLSEVSKNSEKIREGIAYILGEIGDRRAVCILIDLLEDPVGHVRQTAAFSLGKIGDQKAIRPLIKLLEDQYSNVQGSAVEALSLIGGESLACALEGLVHHPLPTIRYYAITLVGKLTIKNNEDKVFLALKDEDPRVREAAVKALGKLSSNEANVGVMGALADEDSKVRLSALKVLLKTQDDDWIKKIEPLTKDESIWVRAAVARGLPRFGDTGKPLLLELINDAVGVVQIAAMEALGKLKETSAVQLLLSKIHSSDPDVRVAAIDSLGCIGDSSVKGPLRSYLNDSHWNVRAAAATALGKLQDYDVRDSLLRLANQDQDSVVRQSARFALDQIHENQ